MIRIVAINVAIKEKIGIFIESVSSNLKGLANYKKCSAEMMNREVFYKMESKSGSGNTRWSPKNLSQKEVCACEPLLEQTELIQHKCPVQTALTQNARITELGKVPQDHRVQLVQPAPPCQPDPTQISPVTSLLDTDVFEFSSLSFPLLI